MRGKRLESSFSKNPQGNIPAYAGKTTDEVVLCGWITEHPRVCGENEQTIGGDYLENGTSPRMRGKPPTPPRPGAGRWNIPAYAGKTFSANPVKFCRREHPRVCGENTTPSTGMRCSSGTSPRMRGKLSSMMLGTCRKRNIPAYAGKTQQAFSGVIGQTEHPRVCGENEIMPASSGFEEGTSPRMRGKLGVARPHLWSRRNIPAYAGKTCHSKSTSVLLSEHPRVCGENDGFALPMRHTAGTSPRMRGKRTPQKLVCTGTRNIPAYAGKT